MLEEAKGLKDKGNMLMSALSAMHDKNSQLGEALNMEKMLKMDIYAHLEDCKQQLSKQRGNATLPINTYSVLTKTN